MAYSVVIEETPDGFVARYPYRINEGYSPPAAWDRIFVSRRDPAMLSPFMERDWASLEVTLVPALVPPPPASSVAEIGDLFTLKSLRKPLGKQIDIESRHDWRPLDFLLHRLAQAGADLRQPLGDETAERVIGRLHDLVHSDASCLVLNQKALFNRQRPWQAAPGIHPMFTPGHPSYPSGHAAVGHAVAWTFARVLARTRYADIGIAFSDYASGVAQRREVAGVHYRSDTVAGMALARFIVDRYEQSEEFRRRYTDVIGAMQ